MQNLLLESQDIKIENQNGNLTVSSRQIAEHFGKRHDSVLRTIDELLGEIGSPRNCGYPLFTENTYINEQNHQQYKEYLITRDGFSLLVMGFTGKRALQWKLKYIEAFNKMAEELKSPLEVDELTRVLLKVVGQLSRSKTYCVLTYACDLRDSKISEFKITEEGAEILRIFKSANVRQRFDLLDLAFSIDDKIQALSNEL